MIFRERFKATPTTFETMIREERTHAAGAAAELALVNKSWDAMPALGAVILRHSKAKLNGAGELPLSGEAKALFPQTMSRIMHPLHTKAALYVRLPVQFTGGCVQELWKLKGSKSSYLQFPRHHTCGSRRERFWCLHSQCNPMCSLASRR